MYLGIDTIGPGKLRSDPRSADTQILTGLTGAAGTTSIASVAGVQITIALSGVIGTGSVGSVIIGTPQAITGVSATGSVGSVTPSISVGLLQVVAVGSTGFVTTSGGVFAGATLGYVPMPGPGTSSPFNLNQFLWDPRTTDLPANTTGTAALTGVTGVGSVGTVTTSSSGGGATLSGVLGTTGVGTVIPSLTIAATGNIGTGGLGTLPDFHNITITGLTVTGSVGSVFPPQTLPLLGVSAFGSVGTVIPISHGIGFVMPNVVGLNYYMALLALQEAGVYDPQSVLNFNQTSIHVKWQVSGSPAGIVVAQSITPGVAVAVNSPVTLTISEFPFGSVIDSPPDWKQRTN